MSEFLQYPPSGGVHENIIIIGDPSETDMIDRRPQHASSETDMTDQRPRHASSETHMHNRRPI